MDIEKLKYPIGQFSMPDHFDMHQALQWIGEIAELPAQIAQATGSQNAEALNQVYRPGGWTLRQVVHHLADSHMNAYIRSKLIVTEDHPTIRPYNEALWAETKEAKTGDIQMSVELLKSIHNRWVMFLKNLPLEDYSRTYFHPAAGKSFSFAYLLGMYAWHGKHHLAHITQTLSKR
ncbi:YfiT family bacillithiol transferase [Pedobacter sandarakinus]|uniref:YfiT family bacillithiol transferase n=1 Tax=Pedobacter sandarakinus TaxID=353156 RepID=UPI0022453C69|nr:putative metal-dependent hydrolase [Pedobacter sandarakinus]MCX2573782.1 putative metal-dependent hydrolase [Pedobacter sandarakinus]